MSSDAFMSPLSHCAFLSYFVLAHILFLKVHLSSLVVVLLASVPTASHLVSGDYGNVTVETFGFSISLRVFSELCYFVDILGGLGIVRVFEREHFNCECSRNCAILLTFCVGSALCECLRGSTSKQSANTNLKEKGKTL